MPRIDFTYGFAITEKSKDPNDRFGFIAVPKKEFKSFDSSTLGLGDISQEGEYIQALAAFFDLEGFTSFGNQVDSHLVVPEFLQRFVDWLFATMAESFKERETKRRVLIWGSLPFFVKFLGDGILFLWDTADTDISLLVNTTVVLDNVTNLYITEFLPSIRKHVSNPPSKLRCGIARGQIISIGNGEDFVGSCINIAARLQKLSQLTFAISRRGFDISQFPGIEKYWKQYVLKKVELRGIGSDELVYIKQKEFRRLPPQERQIFRSP